MSIILDALRQGPGKPISGPNPSTSQTDAVLHTLGYGRPNPATSLNRVQRTLVYVAIAALPVAVALWIAIR